MPWYHLYVDESSLNHRYLVIGGISFTPRREEILASRIRSFRDNTGMYGELKWRKVSRAKLREYCEFVDIFFNDRYPRFRCIVIDTRGKIWRLWREEDRRTAFYKAYYILLKGHMSFLDFRYRVFCDKVGGVKSEQEFQKLRYFINRYLGYPKWNRSSYISSITLVDSKECSFIQLVDILVGSVAAAWNKQITSKAKLTLLQHICNRVHVHSIDARIDTKKFNILPIF